MNSSQEADKQMWVWGTTTSFAGRQSFQDPDNSRWLPLVTNPG